jgi:hypothetical protein
MRSVVIAAAGVLGAVAGSARGAAVGAYAFDEPAGPTRFDAAGGGNDNATFNGSGALYAQPPIPNGTYGSLTLSGTPLGATGGLSTAGGEWITSSGASYDALTNNFTAMAWINPTDTTGVKRVFGRNRLSGSANNGWSFGIDGTQLIITNHGVADHRSSAGADTTGWQHVAITKSSTGGITFYRNGDVVSTLPAETANFSAVSGALPNWLLLNTFGGQNFVGLVDEVRLFDTPLTQAEIRSQAVTPIPEPVAAGLVLPLAGLLLGRRRRQRPS